MRTRTFAKPSLAGICPFPQGMKFEEKSSRNPTGPGSDDDGPKYGDDD